MTALPPATDFTGSTVTEAQFKTALTNLRAYLNGLLDDSGVPADARAALGAGDIEYSDTRFYCGSITRDLTTASGNQAVTGVGFAPKSVIFVAGITTGAAGGSVGFSDGATNLPLQLLSGDSFTQPAASDFCIYISNPTTSDYQLGAVASLDADGFTIAWTKTGSATGTATVNYIAFR